MNVIKGTIVLMASILTWWVCGSFFRVYYENKVQKKVTFSNNTHAKSLHDGRFAEEDYSKGSDESLKNPSLDYFKNIYLSRPQGLRRSVEMRTKREELNADVTSTRLPFIMTNRSGGFNMTFDEKLREEGFYVTRPEEHPYAVLLYIKSSQGEGICSGTLVTEEWVVTAAHCLDFGYGTTIDIFAGGKSLTEYQTYVDTLYGNSKAQKRSSEDTYIHPKYVQVNSYDIGLVKARGKFKMTATVQTVAISTEPWTDVGYVNCVLTGFGKVFYSETSSYDYERKTHYLFAKNPCLCNFRLKAAVGRLFAKWAICSRPENDYGVCSGDSGGGLICGGKLVATTSVLLKMYDTKHCNMEVMQSFTCGTDRGLSVFQGVCPHLRWINDHIGKFYEREMSSECKDDGNAQTVRPNTAVVLVTIATLFWMF